MIKALVFDFDGTVLDTESAAYDAFCDVFRDHGLELSLERWALGIGTWGAYDPYADLEESLGRAVDRRAIRERFEAACAERIRGLAIRPGVMETLEEARRRGLRIGLATSSYRRSVEPHLREYGLLDYFEAIHTADEVAKVKPDPALYRLALESFGVKGAEAVAIEDSVNGLRAAKAAGLHGLAVPNELTAFMDFSEADLLLPSLAEMPMDEWLGRLAAISR
ncbi:HAD family hydrolase [Cohnella zeiphila]|uniref:HAD-IA family hydrolase n=1 Tax=Cohnella zeiphila TaxID=2761120 RepID=A0A7X0SHK0_9BACL|nr:HAD-IA family hydrolase [Cohnella zeiphila]MBB6730001.1 HAD-IA family hydrolase [Cohnella zeiphila]